MSRRNTPNCHRTLGTSAHRHQRPCRRPSQVVHGYHLLGGRRRRTLLVCHLGVPPLPAMTMSAASTVVAPIAAHYLLAIAAAAAMPPLLALPSIVGPHSAFAVPPSPTLGYIIAGLLWNILSPGDALITAANITEVGIA